jgi:hypothetical protein
MKPIVTKNMTNILGGLIKKQIKVEKIIQNNGDDKFIAKLENKNSIEITRTQWHTDSRKKTQEDGSIIFYASNGLDILFNKEQIELLN